MEALILLFRSYPAWLSRCIWLLACWLLMTQQVLGQLYTGKYADSRPFSYFDLATQTWISKANPPTNYLYDLAYYQGKLYSLLYEYVYIYNISTNSWVRLYHSTARHRFSVTAGNYIYGVNVSSGDLSRYDPATNTFTQLAPTVGGGHLTYDGGDYIYAGLWGGSSLKRYSISNNTWTTLSTPPHRTDGVAFKNGKVYIGSGASLPKEFSYYDPVTQTYKRLAVPTFPIVKLIAGPGKYLYATSNSAGWARYDISTNTWTAMPGIADINLTYAGEDCSLTASVNATQATCITGGGVNANAALTLASYGSSITKVGYSTGTVYTGSAYSAATAVTTAPMTLVNNLANPALVQPYTIRVFKDAACYKDIVVTLTPKVCLTSDVSLSVSPPTQSGAKGEQLTYTFTLTNAGPDTAPNATVRIPIPNNTQFLSATASQGSYNSAMAIWEVGSVAVGTQTIKLTVQVK